MIKLLVSLSAAAVLAGSAHAAEFIETVYASGTLGGSTYTDATLNFVGTGSLPSVQSSGSYYVPLSSLSVSGTLDGGGSFDASFTDNVQVFSNTTNYALGFTDENVQFDIADTRATTGPYDLNSSFAAGGAGFGNIFTSFSTNDGLFAIDSFGVATFTEIAGVPEPATWAVMLLGVGAMGASLRSRRKVAMSAI